MPAFQIVALDTITPQLRAPATGDTYSAPRALALAGETLTGSQATPTLDITQTWNTTGTPTAYRLNVTDTASNAGSLLMDLQTGGTSRFSIDKNGRGLSPLNSNTIPALATSAASDRGFGFYANRPSVLYGTNVVWSWQDAQTMSLGSTSRIAWTSGNPVDATPDLFILRDATDILAQRRTTNAQMFRIYETFTDASNYSRMEVGFDAGNLAYVVRSFSAGTGTQRPIALMTGGNVRWSIGATTGHFLAGVDNTYDIGASGATRPRNIFAGGDIYTQSNSTGFYFGSAADLALLRDEANVLAQRRSTNAQAFRIYNTFTSSTDYERGFVRWSANALQIGSESAGTGVARGVVLLSADHLDLQSAAARSIRFAPAGTTVCWLFNSSGNFLANADNTYDIGASAANRPRDLWLARNADVRGSVYIGGFVELLGISAGVVCLRQFATSDFNRLQFGGTTASFPSIQRNGNELRLRLADDSGFCPVRVSQVGFNGATASFPMLSNNGATLQTKLADDSAFAPHAMQYLDVTDGVTAPGASTGRARIYVDAADGDLKIVFADGVVKTIVTDT